MTNRTTNPATGFTTTEMMTIAAARLLKNNAVCFVGIGLPSTAANLARLTHAPDVVLIYESGPIGAKPHVLPLSIGDGDLAETADTVVSTPEILAAESTSVSWARRRSIASPISTPPSSAITIIPRRACPAPEAPRKSPAPPKRCS
jgi:acyl CoA:acetate/3-ketoacid CoA transferase beta subunit